MGNQIPVIAEKPLPTCGWRKFQLDPLGDHLNTCTTHSGAKKAHDWMVDQIADLFHTTNKVKTQKVVKNRGHHCGDIELEGYLANEAGPVPLVLDLRIAHDRVGSSTDPTLTGSSGNWPFFFTFRSSDWATNQWNLPLPPCGVLCAAKSKSRQYPHQGSSFTYQLKYWWDTYNFKNTYSPITLANISSINLVSIFRCFSSPSNPVYARLVDSSALVLSLSSDRHSYIGLVFSSHFID